MDVQEKRFDKEANIFQIPNIISNIQTSVQRVGSLKDLYDNHWKTWPDKPLPGLGNVTPRQAAETVEGREKLEAMLLDFESKNQTLDINKYPHATVDVDFLKRELGLVV